MRHPLAWFLPSVGLFGAMPWLSLSLSRAGVPDEALPFWLMSLPLARLIVLPLWTRWADHQRAARTALGMALGLVVLGAVGLTRSPWAVLPLAAGLCPISALGDALVLKLLGEDRDRYPKLRAAGSVAYAAVALGLSATRPEAAPLALLTGAILAWVASRGLPEDANLPGRAGAVGFDRGLLLLAALQGMTIATYDSLFALHVARSGLPGLVTGWAIATGIAVEVAVLLSAPFWIRRLGERGALLLGVASGVPRWALTAMAPSVGWLIAAQGLHGLGFGLFFSAAVLRTARTCPPNRAAQAQGALSATLFGAGSLLGLITARLLLPGLGTSALFGALAVVSLIATLAAGPLLSASGRPRR